MGIIKKYCEHVASSVTTIAKLGEAYGKVHTAHSSIRDVHTIDSYEKGWLFGPHREYDAKTWKEKVLPLIGSTNSYNDKIRQADDAFMKYVNFGWMYILGNGWKEPQPLLNDVEFTCGNKFFTCSVKTVLSIHGGTKGFKFIIDLSHTPIEIRNQFISMIAMLKEVYMLYDDMRYIECVGKGCGDDTSSKSFTTLLSYMEICHTTEDQTDCFKTK